MPEGPSLVILREQAQVFEGKRILRVEGNAKFDHGRLKNRTVQAVRTWGKHFLLELPDVSAAHPPADVRQLLHRHPQARQAAAHRARLRQGPRAQFLQLRGPAGRGAAGPAVRLDRRRDVGAWDPELARQRLLTAPGALACDALLEQSVFSGVGNIIKNEVLFRIRVHPLSRLGALPDAKLRELVAEARNYSFDFLEWKKAFVLRKHWLAHTKRTCPRCDIPFRKGHLGVTGPAQLLVRQLPGAVRVIWIAGQARNDRFFALSSSCSRSTRRCTLPVVVIGRASMNSISLGYS
jgi:endonuclease-8